MRIAHFRNFRLDKTQCTCIKIGQESYNVQKGTTSNKNAVTVHSSVDNSLLLYTYLHHLALHVFLIFDK